MVERGAVVERWEEGGREGGMERDERERWRGGRESGEEGGKERERLRD